MPPNLRAWEPAPLAKLDLLRLLLSLTRIGVKVKFVLIRVNSWIGLLMEV